MSSSDIIVNNRRPKRDFHGIAILGIKTYNLAMFHQAKVEPRIPQGMLPALKTDLVALGVAVPAAQQAHLEAVGATGTRTELVEDACAHLTAMRKTVRTAKASKPVQRAYGSGQTIDARDVNLVTALVDSALKRIEDHPEDVTDFCFAAEDIDALKALRAALGTATMDQKEKQAGAPLSTKERNIIANRIQHVVLRISSAGARAFATQADIRAEFEALHVNPPAKKKPPAAAQPKAPKASAATTPATAATAPSTTTPATAATATATTTPATAATAPSTTTPAQPTTPAPSTTATAQPTTPAQPATAPQNGASS
ncbi:MAG: hypothetical protein QM820_54315 [Minicystis sp.]